MLRRGAGPTSQPHLLGASQPQTDGAPQPREDSQPQAGSVSQQMMSQPQPFDELDRRRSSSSKADPFEANSSIRFVSRCASISWSFASVNDAWAIRNLASN